MPVAKMLNVRPLKEGIKATIIFVFKNFCFFLLFYNLNGLINLFNDSLFETLETLAGQSRIFPKTIVFQNK